MTYEGAALCEIHHYNFNWDVKSFINCCLHSAVAAEPPKLVFLAALQLIHVYYRMSPVI